MVHDCQKMPRPSKHDLHWPLHNAVYVQIGMFVEHLDEELYSCKCHEILSCHQVLDKQLE